VVCFLDQAIHEFDIARFLMGDVTEVSAWGTVRFHPDAQELGDVDTATTFLRFSSGALGVVENSKASGVRLRHCHGSVWGKWYNWLFRLSQRLRCATITRTDISWTITISLWIVLAQLFALS